MFTMQAGSQDGGGVMTGDRRSAIGNSTRGRGMFERAATANRRGVRGRRGNRAIACAVVALGLAAWTGTTSAQLSNEWKFQAAVYGYFPDIGGSTTFPERTGGGTINVDANTIIANLKFVFMGAFEARKDRWGLFTDLIYMDVGGSKSRSRDLTIGNVGLPIGVTADMNLDVKATVWTVAGMYMISADPVGPVDLLAGVRYLDLEETLGWGFSADLGPAQPSRTGSSRAEANNWDAIVGVKGRIAFGNDREWFVPYYADVGTGDSDLTWQAFAALGYSFRWGDVVAGWRYLDYNFKSGKSIKDANLNGPIVGVAFRW